jgi:hypothetical protein
MQESYSERLAIYTGPESCGVVREDNAEALTGESAGRLFSRETSLRSADAFRVSGRHHRMRRYREAEFYASDGSGTFPKYHSRQATNPPNAPAGMRPFSMR